MEKIRISAVRYANTYPFIYGLTETGFDRKVILETDHPADCAAKLISGKADIGLIPIAALPMMKEYHIITDYCLGAYGKVRTVLLLSNCNFNSIQTINLDYRSRSSVNLARILAKNFWKKEFTWCNTSEGFDFLKLPPYNAVVLIGDQCFECRDYFRYKIDLAGEWCKFTGLPFAFACWTANRNLDRSFLSEFNEALRTGVTNIPDVVRKFGSTGSIRGEDLYSYLTVSMDFELNDEKRKAIKLFLDLMARL
ncbi:MAG: menaquinone biosynthesis protein [Bacteroidales bacterium]